MVERISKCKIVTYNVFSVNIFAVNLTAKVVSAPVLLKLKREVHSCGSNYHCRADNCEVKRGLIPSIPTNKSLRIQGALFIHQLVLPFGERADATLFLPSSKRTDMSTKKSQGRINKKEVLVKVRLETLCRRNRAGTYLIFFYHNIGEGRSMAHRTLQRNTYVCSRKRSSLPFWSNSKV